MNILFYIESLRLGGKERRLVELIKGLSKNPKIKMELVLTKEDILYQDIFSTGIKIHYTLRKKIKKDPFVFLKFYKIAKAFKPDIIHVWGGMTAIYSIPAKLLLNVQIVNNSITYARKVDKLSKIGLFSMLSFAFSNKVIANSKAGLLAHGLYENSKYRVIYNGYDLQRNNVKLKDLRKELNISKDSFLVGMIGRFSDAKDYKTFIDAAVILSKNTSNIHFLCVGKGENMKRLQDYIHEKNISNIHFLGHRSDIENICMNLDVGVLLSNVNGHAEGISNVIMEMMASGLPIIATEAGGTPEIVENEFSGFLVPPFNENIVAQRIKSFYENKELRKTMGEHGKEIINKRFLIGKMVDAYSTLYFNILDKNLSN